MAMVIAFGVMFSTFLSGPVAMVATFACVLLGFSAEQIYDTRHFIDSGIERGGGPIESMVRLLRQDAMTTQLDVDTAAAKVIKTVDDLLGAAVGSNPWRVPRKALRQSRDRFGERMGGGGGSVGHGRW